MTSLVYINEGPAQAIALAIIPSAEEAEAQELVWHPVIYVGRWDHSQYGKFEVKLSDLQEIISNFEAGLPLRGGIPIDEDGVHTVRGEGAFGWVEKLEIRDDALWAGIKWTQDGIVAIEDGRYKYLSASFYIGENPHAKTSVLEAGALCTRPFFTQQPELQIAASEYNYSDEDATTTQTGGSGMTNQEARAKYVELKGEVTDEEWVKITEGVETDEALETLATSFAEGSDEGAGDGGDGGTEGGEENSLEEQLAEAKTKVGELEQSVVQEKEAKDTALAATQTLTERVDVLEKENKEAKLHEEIAAVDLGDNKRYSPAAVDLLVAVQVAPGEGSIKAMQAHMQEHSGSMDTVIMGEVGAVSATTATGELSDEQWLEQKQITDETKKEVQKIAATEKIGFRQAYNQIIEARM